ncbi:MAG: hypothetical protein MJE66_17435 [Proteobacteria bacterium]|nr:hypothetical protein [Pseudomonadota bacterium]
MTERAVVQAKRELRLSESVFGVEWDRWLPRPLGGGGAVLRAAEAGEVEAFLTEHQGEIVAPERARTRFGRFGASPAQARFSELAMDSFAIERGGRTVGIFVGQAWDWSTYYLRYLAMLPEARGCGSVAGIIEDFGEWLAPHGFERLEVDVSVSHLAQLRRMIGCGFYVMGTLQSERWGALVHLVRFLSQSHEDVFLDQFSAGLRRSPPSSTPTQEA